MPVGNRQITSDEPVIIPFMVENDRLFIYTTNGIEEFGGDTLGNNGNLIIPVINDDMTDYRDFTVRQGRGGCCIWMRIR